MLLSGDPRMQGTRLECVEDDVLDYAAVQRLKSAKYEVGLC